MRVSEEFKGAVRASGAQNLIAQSARFTAPEFSRLLNNESFRLTDHTWDRLMHAARLIKFRGRLFDDVGPSPDACCYCDRGDRIIVGDCGLWLCTRCDLFLPSAISPEVPDER